VPEPSALALLLTALLIFFAARVFRPALTAGRSASTDLDKSPSRAAKKPESVNVDHQKIVRFQASQVTPN
jgi:hypothetical protein